MILPSLCILYFLTKSQPERDMFDKLKKLFVIEDENAAKKEETKAAENPVEETVDTSTNTGDISHSDMSSSEPEAQYNTPSGKADPKFINILLKAIEKNNLDGFDYLEYKSSLQGLDNMDMDEATRYKSAFVMAKTMGVTPDKLMSSAKHYVGILNKEESKFKEALKNQRQKQVIGKEDELKRLRKEVETKKAQIKKLEQEIAATEKSYDKIKGNINQNAAKVEATNDTFMNAYKIVLGQIMTDVDNMKKYLK